MNTLLEFLCRNVDLGDGDTETLAREFHPKRFDKGSMIHHVEHVHDSIYFIESGIARGYYIDENGKDTTWYIYFNDENAHLTNLVVFDYFSYLNALPSNLHFEAISDCTFQVVPKALIEHLCQQDVRWSEFMREASNQAYSLVHEKYFAQLVCNAEARFAKFLQETPHLLEKVPQYHIASFLGITPQHLSRLKKMNLCE
ncbi:MAG: Crp/Fnr family transcriptional regulator [Sulfuricurvum sp.]